MNTLKSMGSRQLSHGERRKDFQYLQQLVPLQVSLSHALYLLLEADHPVGVMVAPANCNILLPVLFLSWFINRAKKWKD